MNLRAVAAVVELFWSYEDELRLDNWARWGVRSAPRRPEDEIHQEQAYLPSEFAREMLWQH